MTGLRNPLALASGLGSARDGTHHWWLQRLTAIALALLSPWFVFFMVSHRGNGYVQMHVALADPINASLMVCFVLAMLWHARLGLQVIVEDYVHVRWVEVALQVTIRFAYTLAAVLSVLAIARIALSS